MTKFSISYVREGQCLCPTGARQKLGDQKQQRRGQLEIRCPGPGQDSLWGQMHNFLKLRECNCPSMLTHTLRFAVSWIMLVGMGKHICWENLRFYKEIYPLYVARPKILSRETRFTFLRRSFNFTTNSNKILKSNTNGNQVTCFDII